MARYEQILIQYINGQFILFTEATMFIQGERSTR
jgi:hypothetical protein